MSGHGDQLESTVKSRAAEETGEQAAAETASVVTNGAPAPDTAETASVVTNGAPAPDTAETASVVTNGAPAPDTDDRTVSPVSQSVPQKHPSEASPVSTGM